MKSFSFHFVLSSTRRKRVLCWDVINKSTFTFSIPFKKAFLGLCLTISFMLLAFFSLVTQQEAAKEEGRKYHHKYQHLTYWNSANAILFFLPLSRLFDKSSVNWSLLIDKGKKKFLWRLCFLLPQNCRRIETQTCHACFWGFLFERSATDNKMKLHSTTRRGFD